MIWTRDTYFLFLEAFKKAQDDGAAIFKFEGYEFDINYAKYLIETLRPKWGD